MLIHLDKENKASKILSSSPWSRVMPEQFFFHQNRAWALVSGLILSEKIPTPPLRQIYLINLSQNKVIPISRSTDDFSYFQKPKAALNTDKDQVCIAYEALSSSLSALFWRCYDLKNELLQAQEILVQAKTRELVRRPSIIALEDGFAIAYDRWQAKRLPLLSDPVYQIGLILKKGKEKTSFPELIKGTGMNYAPSIALSDNGKILIAFHSNSRHSLLKFPELVEFDVQTHKLRRADLSFLKGSFETTAHSQGDEFPNFKILQGNVLALMTRPAHGSHLHLFNSTQYQFHDLDAKGWGARDLSGDFVQLTSGKILVARREPKEVQFQLLDSLPMTKSNQANQIKLIWTPIDGTINAAKPVHVPLAKTAAPNIYFGDIHTHSAHSDGTGSPDEIYARLYQRGLDFAALTDHDNIVGSRLFPSQFEENIVITEWFNHLPGFVTLQGQEWTTPVMPRGFGHKNIYYAHSHPHTPPLSFKGSHTTTHELFTTLKKLQAFAVPHHTGWTGMDWENHDEQVQPLFEIASVHGVYEDLHDNPFKTSGAMEGMFARDGLAQAHHFGFVGASDAHGLLSHHGNGRHIDPWGHGLSGVRLKILNRKNLWQALAHQQVWATTGTKIELHCHRHNDMFHVKVQAPDPISEISLVVDGKISSQLTLEKNKKVFVTKFSLPANWKNSYARILTQGEKENGEAAFCSPLSNHSHE